MKRKLLCLLLSMLLVTTTAQAAEKPNAAVDTSRSCTLTLQYAASGQTVRLYRAADISSNGRYTLCGAFVGYGIFMPAGNGQAEWDALRDTLLAYIAADALAPVAGPVSRRTRGTAPPLPVRTEGLCLPGFPQVCTLWMRPTWKWAVAPGSMRRRSLPFPAWAEVEIGDTM